MSLLAAKGDIPHLLAEPTEDSTLIAAGIGRTKGIVASLDSDKRIVFATSQQQDILGQARRSKT